MARKHAEHRNPLLDFLVQDTGAVGTSELRSTCDVIPYADDFTVSSDDVEADRLRDETGEALKEIVIEIDQSKSCHTRQEMTEWNHRTLSFTEKIVVLGAEAAEWNSTGRGRVLGPSAPRGSVRIRWACRGNHAAPPQHEKDGSPVAYDITSPDDDWTGMKLPTSLQGIGLRAVTSQLEVSYDTTKKKTRAHAERIQRDLTGKPDERNEVGRDAQHQARRQSGAMTGPFKLELVDESKGHSFSISISRTRKTYEIITAHKLFSGLNTTLRKLLSWPTADRELEPLGPRPRLNKGCQTTNGLQLPDEGCASGEKERRNCECGLSKDESVDHTPWHARRARGELKSMTQCETAFRDKFAAWAPRPTWRESRTAMVKAI